MSEHISIDGWLLVHSLKTWKNVRNNRGRDGMCSNWRYFVLWCCVRWCYLSHLLFSGGKGNTNFQILTTLILFSRNNVTLITTEKGASGFLGTTNETTDRRTSGGIIPNNFGEFFMFMKNLSLTLSSFLPITWSWMKKHETRLVNTLWGNPEGRWRFLLLIKHTKTTTFRQLLLEWLKILGYKHSTVWSINNNINGGD